MAGFYSGGDTWLCWQKETKSIIQKCGEIIIVKKGKFMNFYKGTKHLINWLEGVNDMTTTFYLPLDLVRINDLKMV